MYKHAALSPAIQALQQTPTPEAAKQAFEQMVSETAYKTFGTQFPDLVEHVVTFRLLASDADKGTAFGAFILDISGQPAYAPVVMNDSELAPMDILYSKTEDQFVPLSREWIDEIQNGGSQALGESAQLPDTVATDVDIRNLMVPPTTGRYSYASTASDAAHAIAQAAEMQLPAWVRNLHPMDPVRETFERNLPKAFNSTQETLHRMGGRYSYAADYASEAAKIAADASHPLARALCKRASEQFDPQLWQGFVSNFSQHNGVTPGVALDQGQMDLDILSKMYKSYVKTWQMPAEAQAQAAEQQAMQGGGMPQQDPNAQQQQQQPQGYAQDPNAQQPKMASAPASNLGRIMGQAGDWAARHGEHALMGAGSGAVLGGLTSVYDNDYSDMGGRMMRGAVGGGLGGMLGGGLGSALERRAVQKFPGSQLAASLGELGVGLGAFGGALGGALPDRRFGAAAQPAFVAQPAMDPTMDPGMYRFASATDYHEGLISMVKHAKAEPRKRDKKLLRYLDSAPNAVKVAFTDILKKDRGLLKRASEVYGVEPLLEALRTRAEKTAGVMNESPSGLRMIDSRAGAKSFGKRSPLAFRGVQLRGYYFEDSRPARNLATIQQEYHDTHDAREPGVYKLWRADGSQTPALVLTAPTDLIDEGRPTFPNGREGISKTRRYAPNTLTVHPEPETTENVRHPEPDVERSHKLERLIVLPNGRYRLVTQVHGEQVTESALRGSRLWNTLFSDDRAAPRSGLGMFAYKRGAHYFGTKPVKLENVTTADGVISGKMRSADGWGEKGFRIDMRSPQSRLMRPRGEGFVVIPAHWKWIPLEGRDESDDLLMTASSVIDLALNRLGSMGAHRMVVRSTGPDSVTVDNGRSQMPKAAALKVLADRHDISGNDAEAILKIAELEGRCTALVVPKAGLLQMSKFASPIEQAFSEVLQGLQGNLEQLQGQVQVLQSVQQRAQELSGEAGQDPSQMQQTDPAMAQQGAPQDPNAQPQQGAPQDPNAQPQQGAPQDPNAQMQQAPQGAPQQGASQDPNAQMQQAPQGAPQQDPNAQMQQAPQQGAPQQGAPQDPNAQQQQQPLPVMPTEGPSSSEIAQQVNPAYMQQAAQLQNDGVFDAGVLAELQRASAAADPGSALRETESKDLSETVDDLGRTLLSMQLRAIDLQEQMGLEGYQKLEDQVRNSFKGLGELLLEMKRQSTALNHATAPN